MTHAIASLGEISERYDAVLSDVWGVIHDGKAMIGRPPEQVLELF